ncbi:MAG TPA: chemotaxis protein CheW [Hyphomonadaceae bacterium]|nr:chemotaxis protein CheW [Hyphomonadaceae bacterium]
MQDSVGQEFITFRIGAQEFCVDIMAVREIRGWTEATPLPQAPSYVRGVINLRGAVLPIVDLAARLGLGDTQASVRNVIIVVRIGPRLVGLLVDAVSEVLTATSDMIQPTPDISCDAVRMFIKSIIAIEGRMISWITLDKILPEQEAEAA